MWYDKVMPSERGIQMWKLDENDPLDRLILQELRGEPVDFVQWDDMLEELKEEPNDEELLRSKGYTTERGLREGEIFRSEFFQLLEKYHLPADDRLKLCYDLAGLAIDNPSDDVIYIVSALLSGGDFLLDENREDYQGEMGACSYLNAFTGTSDSFQTIKHRRAMAARFQALLPELKKKHTQTLKEESSLAHAVFQEYQKEFPSDQNEAVFLGNIEYLLQISAVSPALHVIEPLFLYQAVTRHERRLHSSDSLRIDFKALWKYKKYQVTRNNGKNFKSNRARLSFFANLCSLYKNDPAIDLELSCYGFEQLSNLGDFYREEVVFENFPEPPTLQLELPETIEELIMYHTFAGYEDGGRNLFVEEDSSLTDRKVETFREDPQYKHAFRKIEDYMNQRQGELVKSFWNADDKTVRTLCQSILEDAEIPARHRPRDLWEVSLFLATINEVLLEMISNFVDRLLALTVRVLIGEETEYAF